MILSFFSCASLVSIFIALSSFFFYFLCEQSVHPGFSFDADDNPNHRYHQQHKKCYIFYSSFCFPLVYFELINLVYKMHTRIKDNVSWSSNTYWAKNEMTKIWLCNANKWWSPVVDKNNTKKHCDDDEYVAQIETVNKNTKIDGGTWLFLPLYVHTPSSNQSNNFFASLQENQQKYLSSFLYFIYLMVRFDLDLDLIIRQGKSNLQNCYILIGSFFSCLDLLFGGPCRHQYFFIKEDKLHHKLFFMKHQNLSNSPVQKISQQIPKA